MCVNPHSSNPLIYTLSVSIKQAKNLTHPKGKSSIDPYVKCYLLPDKSSSSKRKTKALQGTLFPIWEEQLIYEKVSKEDLMTKRVLEVTVWDSHRGSSNQLLGGFRLGPSPIGIGLTKRPEYMDCIGKEISHWEEMMRKPGEWVTYWHSLRDSMDPRDITY